MKLKLDEAGHVVVQDGKPVYLTDDGKEIAFDVAGTSATISRLNAEAKGHRERAETAEGKLKTFEGIADPAEALKALATMQNIDAKKLIDAGEVERVKSEIAKGFTEKLTAAEKRAADIEGQLYAEKIGGSFARSKFISEKAAIPADLMQARFGQSFKIEEGKIAAYDQNGNKLYSRANPGELAGFEEALEILVDGYAYRDSILKGNSNGGSGTREGQGQGGAKTMTRKQFETLDPASQAKAMTVDKITLVD